MRRELLREQTAELIAQVVPTTAEEDKFVSPVVLAAEWERDAAKKGSNMDRPVVVDEELLKVRDRYVAGPRPSVYGPTEAPGQPVAGFPVPVAPLPKRRGSTHGWAPAW